MIFKTVAGVSAKIITIEAVCSLKLHWFIYERHQCFKNTISEDYFHLIYRTTTLTR